MKIPGIVQEYLAVCEKVMVAETNYNRAIAAKLEAHIHLANVLATMRANGAQCDTPDLVLETLERR